MIDEALAAIRAGQPVILPTDTVYGLCASAQGEEPTRLVYRLKARPETMPSTLLCADLAMLLDAVPELRGRIEPITSAFLPGPYTLVLPNPARRFPWLTGASPGTIGVRVPRLEGAAREIVERAGPLASTSANLHGAPEAARLEDVAEELRRAAGAVVDGGELPGVPSTVLDFTGNEPRVLREGAGPWTIRSGSRRLRSS